VTELHAEVCRLLVEERLSSKQVGERLGLSPSQVMAIKNGKLEHLPRPTSSPGSQTGTPPDLDEADQIRHLRKRVRAALLERFDDFPPHVLVRLWQLIEDPKLLEGSTGGEEVPFEIPEDVREKIFALLDAG
jgi:hypothetical protein